MGPATRRAASAAALVAVLAAGGLVAGAQAWQRCRMTAEVAEKVRALLEGGSA